MAQGDIRSALVSIPSFTYASVQPGAGEHWIVRNLLSENWGSAGISQVEFYDGSLLMLIFTANSAPPAGVFDMLAGFWTQSAAGNKAAPAYGICLNNGVYMRLRNWTESGYSFAYTALQIK